MEIKCVVCGKSNLDRDTIGINKKLINKDVKTFYCMECLAGTLEVTVEELQEKIEDFKEEGCTLFM